MTGMQRYSGEHLGSPHIVVLGSCKVGNFVVSTPVVRGLRAAFRCSNRLHWQRGHC